MTLMTPPSELILPPGIVRISEPEADASDDEKASALPKPTGFHILCIVPEASARHDKSMLLKAKQTIQDEESGTTVLFVLALGPDAYKDTARFPGGPWCKPGDFVLVRRYSGTKFKIFNKAFRVINDDMVECVVADPRGVEGA